jgi:hypothetical protein
VFALLPLPGDESFCTMFGLDVPDADTLHWYTERREAEWLSAGGADGGSPDPRQFPMCVVPQLIGADLDSSGSCASSQRAGWCAEHEICKTEVAFTPAASPTGLLNGALITFACSEGC